ncbi:6-hydroxynicotinate 3-monooxygenase [Beauveria bassiana]|uniref:6-hydroxynicotinate 3-monooxygenase n=1 Tax=Beauveria bassiana TaxID=176275 RepID=A0A2N6NRV1_BEABA|nr:6-hydroxynicotinate 3-monooxygenase [Beauveria bassiana]
MAENKQSLRVLIAGAGIGGLATAISLARVSSLSKLDIQIYEQAPELVEIGASIALSPNGMRTLERLGVHEALSDHLGFRGPSGIPQIFRHWKSNQVVSVDTHTNVPDGRHQTTRFHRGHLHAALLAHVPGSSIHLNKSIVRAEATEKEAVLFFSDGTEAHGDLLIAVDGIQSFTGKVFVRSTFDASLVEGKIPDLPLDAVHWWGPSDSFFASRLGKGQYTTVGAYQDSRSGEELDKAITWNQTGNVAHFKEKYKDWNPVVKRLTELTPTVRLFPNYAGSALSTWLPAPRVALLGDAAHTHGGAFAAGGSLALDDALALGLALRHVSESKAAGTVLQLGEVQHALTLYDRTRQPHASKLLDIVHGALAKNQSIHASTEAEDEALIARLKNRPDLTWLSEHDVEAAFARTVRELAGQKKELADATPQFDSKL